MPRSAWRAAATAAAPGRGRRCVVAGLVAAVALVGFPATSLAAPPPPPNPSDSEIDASKAAADQRSGQVGQLTNQLAEAEARLSELQGDVELKKERANKALVDMQLAQDAASQAQRDASSARGEVDAAAAAVERARIDLDRFAAGSFQQGSTVGSMSAYIGSNSPKNLLQRAQMLNAVGGSRLNALQEMQRAQTEMSNRDSAARQALRVAQDRQSEAERAKTTADTARMSAIQAQSGQAARNAQLESERTSVEQRLYEAQSAVTGLTGQRQRYADWVAQKATEDEQRARQAAEAASKSRPSDDEGPAPAPSRRPSGPTGAGVEAVIARAMAQIGLPYAWGGGNASGPTQGIRDGGVADSYGDYRKIGFDCSGLMIYAFAGVKSLVHYSGYQYESGTKVPLSQMRRGDMLFWGDGGEIHHVALYIGNGQMIEAPESGSRVKISPVRYGGIMPNAIRLVN